MPLNKQAYLRYITYDRCLQKKGGGFTCKTLMDIVNGELLDKGDKPIGRTQFYKDLEFLKTEFYAEIEKEKRGKEVIMYYKDPKFSIQNKEFTQNELKQIEATILLLDRIDGLPEFEFLKEIVPTLSAKFLNKKKSNVISFQNNAEYSGHKHFTPLFEAIINKKVLNVEYQKFTETESVIIREFHPQHLKQYNNRWFLFGYNAVNEDEQWNMPLDRIINIETIPGAIYKASETDWVEYFDDRVGVSTLGAATEPTDVELWIHPDLKPYIITKPLHPYQKNTENADGSLLLRLSVIMNYELEREILAYADKIKVLNPPELSVNIKLRMEAALANYSLEI